MARVVLAREGYRERIDDGDATFQEKVEFSLRSRGAGDGGSHVALMSKFENKVDHELSATALTIVRVSRCSSTYSRR